MTPCFFMFFYIKKKSRIHYLIGNVDKYEDINHYRIDRITDIEITDQPIKPIKNVSGMENGLNLPNHMEEHGYMFCGESVTVKIRTQADMMDEKYNVMEATE